MMNKMKMMNDMDLELVNGGNSEIKQTVEAVTNSSVVDYVVDTIADGASTAFDVLKYILFH